MILLYHYIFDSDTLQYYFVQCKLFYCEFNSRMRRVSVHCFWTVVDINGAGAQWCWQEQGAERSYAWSSGLQRPSPHTTIHGAHPQGMALGRGISGDYCQEK